MNFCLGVSGYRPWWWLFLMCGLAACGSHAVHAEEVASAGAASEVIPQHQEKPEPSLSKSARVTPLPAISGPYIQVPEGGRYIDEVPPEISKLLMALPPEDTRLPHDILLQILNTKSTILVADFSEKHAGLGLSFTMKPARGLYYFLSVRSFPSRHDSIKSGYLVQVSMSCETSDGLPISAHGKAVADACDAVGPQGSSSGLLAYLLKNDGTLQNVTSSITPPEVIIGEQLARHYADIGGSAPFADDSRLDIAPSFRWIIESDPDRPFPDDDPRVFDAGGLVHIGFVVWNGERFESRRTVPASLWPCPAGKPSLCPDDDRFVIRQP